MITLDESNSHEMMQIVVDGKLTWVPMLDNPLIDDMARTLGNVRRVLSPNAAQEAPSQESVLDATQYNEIISRLAVIEGGISQLINRAPAAQASAPAAPPAAKAFGGKTSKLHSIQTKNAIVSAVYDDMAGTSEKWNITFTDETGQKFRAGTFDKAAGNAAKAAKITKQIMTVTFGLNAKNYPELVSLQEA